MGTSARRSIPLRPGPPRAAPDRPRRGAAQDKPNTAGLWNRPAGGAQGKALVAAKPPMQNASYREYKAHRAKEKMFQSIREKKR